MSENNSELVNLGIVGLAVSILIAAPLLVNGYFKPSIIAPDRMEVHAWAKEPSDALMHNPLKETPPSLIVKEDVVAESPSNQTEEEPQAYNLPVWEGEADPYAEYLVPQSGYYYEGVSGDPNGLNSFVGVVEWNGTRETAYSSNVLYHYRTSEWTPDEYGFYRTDEGYYVVGSDDYEQGTVIETSRGPAIVSDCGGDPGIVDFYVNW